MFTDALWSTMLSIVLLLGLTFFFKAMFFRHMYDSGSLTTPQVLVDWRLWTLDGWFWIVLVALIAVSISLNLISACLLRACDRRAIRQSREHKERLEKAKTVDSSV